MLLCSSSWPGSANTLWKAQPDLKGAVLEIQHDMHRVTAVMSVL